MSPVTYVLNFIKVQSLESKNNEGTIS